MRIHQAWSDPLRVRRSSLILVLTALAMTAPERGSSGLSASPSHLLATANSRSGSIAANPNPVQVCDGSGLGITTLTWSSTGTTEVQVHVGSPTGTLFADTVPNGSATTGKWVGDGTVFYLQDVSGGLPLTSSNTLATATVNITATGCRTGTITANPSPIQVCDGSGLGITTLSWSSTGTTEVQVRVGSTNGALFADTGPSGSWTTGKWVVNSTVFYLQDVSGGLPLTSNNTLATVAVNLTTTGCRAGTITADANPIWVCDGSGLGITTLFWNSTGTTEVQVRVGSPTGALFADTGPSGSWTTGKWVADGTVFYLQDVSGGLPLTSNNTLATATVNLTTGGCGSPGAVGQWSQPMSWPLVAIHASVLPNGKVISWDTSANAQLWDPGTGTFTLVANSTTPTTNPFCSGHSLLPDGRLLVTGGHHFFNGDGLPHTNIFDYQTNTWSRMADMNLGRWYPTTCALGTGETAVVSGYYCSANCEQNSPNPVLQINPLPQVWQPGAGWRSLTGASRSALPLYPWLLLAPDGRAFYAGPERATLFLSTTGAGAWSDGPASNFGYRDYGSSVMYGDGKVLILGGGADPNAGNRPTNTAEVIDLHAPSPVWRYVGSMAYRRRQTIATILADGKILVTNGTGGPGFNNPCGAVRAAEIWDPATEAWTTVASAAVARIYHLTAALLPDGRVLSAGSTGQSPDGYSGCATSQPGELNAELYSPPYLFDQNGAPAIRPAISSAPSSVVYGQTFLVQTPDSPNITRVTWVRLSSVTHSFNQNQRINQLTFGQTSGGLNVTAPVNPTLSPPGDYMLFLLNSAGVPSVAKVIRISR